MWSIILIAMAVLVCAATSVAQKPAAPPGFEVASVKPCNGDESVSQGGGPDWIDSANYRIDAVAADNASQSMMRGPMLQGLIEERFQLKIHREVRKIPVYELVVAKQGFKRTPADGRSCIARDLTQFPPPPFDLGRKRTCGVIKLLAGPHKVIFDLPGASVTAFSTYLPDAAGRAVVDKTGIKGQFDFHMEFARGGVQYLEPTPDNNDGQSVFSALA